MILCGAFDSLRRSRPTLMMELNLFLTLRPQYLDRQAALLTALPTIPNPPGDYTPQRKYADERRVLGITVGEHVLTSYRAGLDRAVDADSRDLPHRVGKRVRIAGVLEALRTTRTQGGRSMTFLTLDDEFGLFEVTLFPGAARSVSDGLARYGPYVVTGRVEDQYGSLTISAQHVAYPTVEAIGRLACGTEGR